MSRFHRDTFHPPKADLASPKRAAGGKPRGKHSGHATPPWEASPHGHEQRESTQRRMKRSRRGGKAGS
jgi:hypothetical protein